MATREELLGGLAFVSAQAGRVGGIIDTQNDWDTKRTQGWTPKEMFIHVAATAGMIPMMGPGMLSAPAEAELTAGLDIASLNESAVAPMRAQDAKAVVSAIQANNAKLSDWIKTVSDEQLQGPHTFLSMKLSASDLIMTLCVLHSTHHIYEAQLPVAV